MRFMEGVMKVMKVMKVMRVARDQVMALMDRNDCSGSAPTCPSPAVAGEGTQSDSFQVTDAAHYEKILSQDAAARRRVKDGSLNSDNKISSLCAAPLRRCESISALQSTLR
jgi:hypothetical protein